MHRSKVGKVALVGDRLVVICEAPPGLSAGDLVAVAVGDPSATALRPRVAAAIQRCGGEATKSSILRMCQDASAAEIDTCLVDMQESGEVEVRKVATGGRPMVVVRALTPPTAPLP